MTSSKNTTKSLFDLFVSLPREIQHMITFELPYEILDLAPCFQTNTQLYSNHRTSWDILLHGTYFQFMHYLRFNESEMTVFEYNLGLLSNDIKICNFCVKTLDRLHISMCESDDSVIIHNSQSEENYVQRNYLGIIKNPVYFDVIYLAIVLGDINKYHVVLEYALDYSRAHWSDYMFLGVDDHNYYIEDITPNNLELNKKIIDIEKRIRIRNVVCATGFIEKTTLYDLLIQSREYICDEFETYGNVIFTALIYYKRWDIYVYKYETLNDIDKIQCLSQFISIIFYCLDLTTDEKILKFIWDNKMIPKIIEHSGSSYCKENICRRILCSGKWKNYFIIERILKEFPRTDNPNDLYELFVEEWLKSIDNQVNTWDDTIAHQRITSCIMALFKNNYPRLEILEDLLRENGYYIIRDNDGTVFSISKL